MRLQENILFDLDLGVKVTQNVAQVPSTSCLQSLNLLRPTVYTEMHLQENTLFDLDLLQYLWPSLIYHLS